MLTIQIKHKTIDGKPIVQVQLDPRKASDDYCILDETGFEELISLGIDPIFKARQGAVNCRSKGKERYAKRDNVSIARILLDADKNQCIRYLNGDFKDLRYSNLILTNGMSLYRARDQIRKEFPAVRYTLNHIYEQQEGI